TYLKVVVAPIYEGVGIFHQKSILRTPQQNAIVERRNHTLVEAARTMLIFSKAPMFLWAEATATALFGALCPRNDSKDLGKLQAKADIGIFVGYAPSRKGYRVYNKITRRLMETIHVTFDELHQTMAPVCITGDFISTDVDEYFEQSRVNEKVPFTTAVNAQVFPPGTSLSTTFAQDVPSISVSPSSSDIQPLVQHQGVADGPTVEDTPITKDALHPSVNPVTGEPGSA
ncbi:retrovirus-related pol polyprotein from transposon TNT 1-94, partial [Tanacetum coccineum]